MGSLRRAFFVGERMTESRKIQLEAEMSTAGVKQGAQDIKATVSDMANAVSQEAGRAGQAVGKIGDGGEQTSQKVDRSTKSMIQSIQRVTAQMEAGSRTSAKYYETLAQQRGVDVNALRPYLDQLDDVSKKQSMASGALAAGAVQFDKYGMSAKQTAAAMRGVPAQLTDIIVSLQGGQQPMTVLLQQGGQLKDMFGGIAPAARALGGAVLGMVNPLTLAAAAVGGLYLAYRAGASEYEAFNRTLIDTGNRAGLTADQLTDMSRRIGDISGTQRQAASALNDFARSSGVATQNFQDFARAAMEWESATGTAVSETVKRFEELGKSPVEASLKLNESMNYLTASTYEQIRALETSGRTSEAAELAQRTYFNTINERAPKVVQNLGLVERGWAAIKREVSEALSAVAGFGRTETLQDRLNKQLEELRSMEVLRNVGSLDLLGTYEKKRQEIANTQELIKLQAQLAGVEADRQRQQQKALQEAQAYNDYVNDPSRMSRADQMAKEIEAETQQYQKRIAAAQGNAEKIERIEAAHQLKIKDIRERFKDDKPGGGISTTQTELARLQGLIEIERQREELLRSITGAQGNLNEGEKLAIQYGEKLKLVTDEKTIAQLQANKALAEEFGARKRSNDEMEKWRKSQESTIDSVTKQTRSLRDQIETYGMGRSAIEEMTIARLEEQIALAESKPGQEAAVEGLKRELAARRELLGAMRTKEGLDAQLKEWQNWEREVDRIFDQLGQSLTDQLFEGGKSARDMLKDMFRALTLRVVVQPMLSGLQGMVTQQVGGLLGYQNPASGNGLMDTAGGLKSTYDAFSGGLNQTLGNGIGWVGEKLGSSALQSFASGLSGTAWTASTPMFALSSVLPATATWAGTAAGLAGTAAAVPSLAGVAAGPGLAASLGTSVGTAGAAASAGAAGIGTAIGAALPWVGGALAIGSLLGGDLFGGGPPKTRHGQRTTAELAGGSYGITSTDDRMPAGTDAAVLTMAQAGVDMANELFRRVGVDAAIDSFYAIAESSVLGDRNGVASGGVLRTGDQTRAFGIPQASDMTLAGVGGWSEAETLPRLQTDIQLSILEAFQTQVDSLPDVLADMIRGVDVRALDAAGAQDLAARFSAVVEGASSFLQLVRTMPFEHLRDLSFDAAAGLVQLAGGVESLMGIEQDYYQNFYTEAERQQHAIDNIAKSLSGVGVEMPAITGSTEQMLAAFRALRESQDLNTEAGRAAYVALGQVSGAFADVARSAEQAAQEQQRIAAQNKQTVIDDLQTAYNDLVNAGQAEIAKLQQTFGETDSAMNSYRSAVQALESEFGSLFTSIDRYISDLRGNVEASAQAQYRQARAVISTALATGQLPQTADLTEALQVAQRGVTSQVYSSLFEQNRAYAILANEMEALKGIAEPELDAAKATLAQLEEQYALLRGTNRIAGDSLSALEQQVRLAFAAEEAARAQISLVEQQLETAKQQYEELMGINSSITDLAAAIREFAAAAAAAKTVVSGGGGGGTGGWTPGNLPAGAENLSAAQRYVLYNNDLLQEQARSGMSVEQYAQFHWNTYGQYEDRDIRYRAMGGYTPPGLTWVGEEGPELVNFKQPGMVYTAAQSANLMGGGGGRDVVMALERIEQRIERLEQPISQTAKATGQLAAQFDNVTAGGNAMATEEMA